MVKPSKGGWYNAALSGRGTEAEKVNKIAYAVVGSISLIIWFTAGWQFMNNTALNNPAPVMIVFWGLLFYAFFYGWLFALAKIVFPKIAIQFAMGLAALYFISDVLFPPYFVTPSGQILTTGATFTFGASDVLLAEMLKMLGDRGPLLFYSTYVIVPIIVMFVLIPIFWTSKKIGKALSRS